MSPTPQGMLLFLIFGCAGWVFVTECRLSLVAGSRGYSLVAARRLLVAVASLVVELRLQFCSLQWLYAGAGAAGTEAAAGHHSFPCQQSKSRLMAGAGNVPFVFFFFLRHFNQH